MLKLIEKAQPTAKQAVMERIKQPKAALQCNTCGCRTSITATNNGTVIFRNICAECWKAGSEIPMTTTLKQVK